VFQVGFNLIPDPQMGFMWVSTTSDMQLGFDNCYCSCPDPFQSQFGVNHLKPSLLSQTTKHS